MELQSSRFSAQHTTSAGFRLSGETEFFTLAEAALSDLRHDGAKPAWQKESQREDT
jgi:hypothetical protein